MELSELDEKGLNYIFANVDLDDRRITKWERGFIESVADQWERKKFLTDRQKETLGKIWDKLD